MSYLCAHPLGTTRPACQLRPVKFFRLLTLLLSSGALAAPTDDWPVYRHDVALSGVSPGKGRIVKPEILWEYYLGAPPVTVAADRKPENPNVADLDGDGTPEKFSLNGKTIEVTDLSGRRLWTCEVKGHPLGGNVRVVSVFPDRKGQQIISFSSRMDSGEGQGYCFAFDRGATDGELVWTTGPLTAQHAPTLIVDDVDGDGLPEIVTAPHTNMQIFNGQTGALKAAVPVAKGRNYGALLSRPRPGHAQKDIFVVCDFVLHAECVRFENGGWVHAWGKKYLENENAARPQGREQYIRAGPNPVSDLDGDGRDEMAYMLVDAATDDRWHLIVHDCETGAVKADIPGIWVWSMSDLDGDGTTEIIYTATPEKRPPTYCELRVGKLRDGKLDDLFSMKNVRPILMNATLPNTANTIADEGLNDLLRADLDGDGRTEIFVGERSEAGRFEDTFAAISLGPDGALKRTWEFAARGHRLNLVSAISGEMRVQDFTVEKILAVDAKGKVTGQSELGRPGGFSTLPIVVDLDGDGRNEIVVQNAAGEILALAPGRDRTSTPKVLWSRPGVAMNPAPGFTMSGGLCPQAADVDGDGKPEIFFAAEDERGRCALVCADARGETKWSRPIEGCPWGGLQAGVDHWSFGHFTDRPRGLDVYVDLHRRSKGSGEGWALRGDTGAVLWQRKGIVAKETAMPFGGGIPAVADVNGDGADDLMQMFYTVYGATDGRTGDPIFPPAYLPGAAYFGKWLAYSEPTVADLDGDGRPDVYLNSRSYGRGGYAAVRADGQPLWSEFHNNDEGSDGLGPVGDFDGDGKLEIAVPVLNGTLLCLNAADGSHKWSIQTPVTGDLAAADVDGDGILDIVFAGRDGKLRAVSGKDGRELWSIAASGTPIVADIDGDGWVEVLVAGGDGILRAIGSAAQ